MNRIELAVKCIEQECGRDVAHVFKQFVSLPQSFYIHKGERIVYDPIRNKMYSTQRHPSENHDLVSQVDLFQGIVSTNISKSFDVTTDLLDVLDGHQLWFAETSLFSTHDDVPDTFKIWQHLPPQYAKWLGDKKALLIWDTPVPCISTPYDSIRVLFNHARGMKHMAVDHAQQRFVMTAYVPSKGSDFATEFFEYDFSGKLIVREPVLELIPPLDDSIPNQIICRSHWRIQGLAFHNCVLYVAHQLDGEHVYVSAISTTKDWTFLRRIKRFQESIQQLEYIGDILVAWTASKQLVFIDALDVYHCKLSFFSTSRS